MISSPPVRLFAGTPYGVSVWARILYERFACFRPLRQVAAWMTDQGLAMAPGTIADSVCRFLPLFAPLAEAILAHQNKMVVRHGDETGWRIQALSETGRSRRAWLWISVGKDAVFYHIDPSRSAEAAMKLFGSVKGTLALVRRHLPEDWAERYNTAPVMIETFVETPRYTGTVYQASGWTLVGTTQGRGRYDRYNKRAQPKKGIWLRPLRKDWKRTLNR